MKKLKECLEWKVEYDTRAVKELQKLQPDIAKKNVAKTEHHLKLNPYSGENLKDKFSGFFRYRIGDSCIIYKIEYKNLVMLQHVIFVNLVHNTLNYVEKKSMRNYIQS